MKILPRKLNEIYLKQYNIMKKYKPNEFCPCWSKRKYKSCYWLLTKSENTCELYLKEVHKSNLKQIEDFINSVTSEVSDSFKILYDSAREKTLRTQCIIIFSYIDFLWRIRATFEWFNDDIWNRERMTNWLDKYCLNMNNKFFKDNTELHKLTSKQLYELRSGLTHSYSLSREVNKTNIIINNNSKHPRWIEFKNKYNKITGKSLILLEPIALLGLSLIWWQIMLNDLNSWKESNKNEFFKKVNKLACSLDKQSAVTIEIK